jgi:hypothetical protein
MSLSLMAESAFADLEQTLAALRAQSNCGRLEAVISRADAVKDELKPEWIEGFHSVKILPSPSASPMWDWRAAAVRAASAPIIALCEDHSFPEPGWAEALLAAHEGGNWAGVGPGMLNYNPQTATSWASFLIEYGSWAYPVRGGEMHHIPGNNSAYRRDVLLKEFGDELGERLRAETAMQWELRRRGHRFLLEPKARTRHMNRSLPWTNYKVHFQAGRVFAVGRCRDWSLLVRLAWAAAAPVLIPAVRFSRGIASAWRVGGLGLVLRVSPILAGNLVSDGLGQMLGYLTKRADVEIEPLSQIHFGRKNYVTDTEKATLRGRAEGDSAG